MVSILISVITFILTLPIKTVSLGVKVAKAKKDFEKTTGIDETKKKVKRDVKKKSRDTALKSLKKRRNDAKEESKLKRFGNKAKDVIGTTIKNFTKSAVKLVRAVCMLLAACGATSMVMGMSCIFFLLSAIAGVLLLDSNGFVTSGTVALAGGTSSNSSSSSSSKNLGSNSDPNNHEVWTIYFQGDSKWGGHPHSTDAPKDNIANEGCGTCATAMVLAHYSGDDEKYTPDKLADKQRELGIGFPNHNANSVVSLINDAYPEVGLTTKLTYNAKIDLDALDKCLADGGCAIVDYPHTVNGINQLWTQGDGHYVVICAGNQKDGYRTVDSNSGHENGSKGIAKYAPYSEKIWAKEYIQPCSYYYLISKK